MAHSERHEDLVAAVALGMPLGADRAELEAHLREGCPQCEELLADLRTAATALASAAPSVAPPPELKDRLLASLGPSRAPAQTSSSTAWRVLAAAAALLAVVVGLDDARLRRQRGELRSQTSQLASRLQSAETELAQRVLRARVLESDDVRMLVLGGKDPQPQARARMFWSERARRGVLVANSLAPLPPDRQYELWVFVKGKPINAGVFDADPQGRALFESTDFPEPGAENFAVTIEPRGGVPAPTGPIVLVGSPA
jgi:anti-sigma-K factor RskA